MSSLKYKAPPSTPHTPSEAVPGEPQMSLDDVLAKLPRDKLEGLVRAAAEGVTGAVVT